MEGMVEVDGDNILGSVDRLVLIFAEALDDGVPSPPAQITAL